MTSRDQNFTCLSKQLKPKSNYPSYQRLMADNFAVQLNTVRHQCCSSKLQPYCFPLIKPRNVPAQIIRQRNLSYKLKTLKHGMWSFDSHQCCFGYSTVWCKCIMIEFFYFCNTILSLTLSSLLWRKTVYNIQMSEKGKLVEQPNTSRPGPSHCINFQMKNILSFTYSQFFATGRFLLVICYSSSRSQILFQC